jgi:hypothetical protein
VITATPSWTGVGGAKSVGTGIHHMPGASLDVAAASRINMTSWRAIGADGAAVEVGGCSGGGGRRSPQA